MPWSWGRGVSVSSEERVVLAPRKVRADDIQEKMGGVPLSQAQGREQISWVEVPDTRVGITWKLGVSVRAGQRGVGNTRHGGDHCG